MTVAKFNELLKQYSIPEDAIIMSNSGWECGPTDPDGVFYEESTNTITLGQGTRAEPQYYIGQKCLYCVAIEQDEETRNEAEELFNYHIDRETRMISEALPF